MKNPSRLDDAFAVGRVRALERQLVSLAVFREAAEETDLSSALKIIFDAGTFLEELVEIHNSQELDAYLSLEEESFFGSISELFLDREVFLIVLERENLKESLIKSEKKGYDFIVDYFKHAVDLGNLKIFARAKYLDLSIDKYRAALLGGGFFDINILAGNYDLSLTELGNLLHVTPYQELWNQAVDTLEAEETFIDLERGFEDFLMEYLRRAKHVVFGPEPIFAYTMAKLKELDLFRLLGIGKLNQIPLETLKKRMSETYV